MTHKHLTFILIFIPLGLFSQQFEKVDSYVNSLYLDNSITLDRLTNKLTSPFPKDIEKVRAIYYWIANNIEYDFESFENKSITEEQVQPDIVFKNRLGVCEGYSNLFSYMLDLCDIESEVISGYARNDIRTVFLYDVNHSWNSVKINNNWYLFDVTWARDTLEKEVRDLYFQTDPSIFILSHYPLDYEWSLLETDYSLEEYLDFPVYTTLFHELKFSDKISKQGNYIAKNDTVTINFKSSLDCLLLTKLYDLNQNEWIPTQRGDFVRGDDYFKLYIPRKGKFILSLGTLIQNDGKIAIYDYVIFYVIDNE